MSSSNQDLLKYMQTYTTDQQVLVEAFQKEKDLMTKRIDELQVERDTMSGKMLIS